MNVTDDLNDVPMDWSMPGEDRYAQEMAERQRRRQLQAAADWRDRMKALEERVANLELKPTSLTALVARLTSLEEAVNEAKRRTDDLEDRARKAIKIIEERLRRAVPMNGTQH